MKKIAVVALLVSACLSSAQKSKKSDILQSNNIQEIEKFLKDSHLGDPRRTPLKLKLAKLKNAEWTKGAQNHKPMEARPIIMTDIPTSVTNRPYSNEAEEFKQLMTETSDAHKAKTVKLLNTLFDQDINKKEAILLIQNNSKCNMIVRIQGDKDYYNLAIPSSGQNSLVVNKGIYQLSSNICNTQYTSTKDITKNQMVILNHTVQDSYYAPSMGRESNAQK